MLKRKKENGDGDRSGEDGKKARMSMMGTRSQTEESSTNRNPAARNQHRELVFTILMEKSLQNNFKGVLKVSPSAARVHLIGCRDGGGFPTCKACKAVLSFFEQYRGDLASLATHNFSATRSLDSDVIDRLHDFPVIRIETMVAGRSVEGVYGPEELGMRTSFHTIFKSGDDDEQGRNKVWNKLKVIFTRAPVKPLTHQQALQRFFRETNWRARDPSGKSKLIYWCMGTGKTKGAFFSTLAASDAESYEPAPRVMIVCELTLLDQWYHDAQSFVTRRGAALIQFVGLTEFKSRSRKNPRFTRGWTVIFDEAQTLRNVTQNMAPAIEALQNANHTLLLTGTPLVNGLDDVAGLVQMMGAQATNDPKIFRHGRVLFNPHDHGELLEFMSGHVSFYHPAVHNPRMQERDYPRVHEHEVLTPLSWQQVLLTCIGQRQKIEINGITFQGPKSSSYQKHEEMMANMADPSDPEASAKVRALAEKLLDIYEDSGDGSKEQRRRQYVFSRLLEKGITPLMKVVLEHAERRGLGKKKKLVIDKITGEVPNAARKSIMARYNRGDIDILFMSGCGMNGVDLYGTYAVHLFEPFRNDQERAQATNRGIRFRSHSETTDKNVHIYSYIATVPTEDPDPATVRELFAILREKRFEAALDGMDGPLLVREIKRLMHERGRFVFEGTPKGKVETVNEKFRRENKDKIKILQPYLSTLQEASIKMPRQGGLSSGQAIRAIRRALSTPESILKTVSATQKNDGAAANKSKTKTKTKEITLTKVNRTIISAIRNYMQDNPETAHSVALRLSGETTAENNNTTRSADEKKALDEIHSTIIKTLSGGTKEKEKERDGAAAEVAAMKKESNNRPSSLKLNLSKIREMAKRNAKTMMTKKQ